MILAAGLALALVSTFAINWGWVAQHASAAALPPLSPRRPLVSLRSLLRHRSWLAGFLAGLGGWVLYVAALRLGPLSLVQAVSAGGIAVIAVLGGLRGRTEATAAALGTVGLALLGVSLIGSTPGGSASSWMAVGIWLAVSAVAAAFAARILGGGVGLALAAGTLYAAGDVATKFAVDGGPHALLAPAVLAAHGLAFVAVQLAFQRGSALATAGTASLLTNSLPIAAGIVLFGEHLAGGLLGAARVTAFALVVLSAALLARREASAASSTASATSRGRPVQETAPAR